MDILAELFGFIEKSCDSDYTVEKCYNNGTIESSKLVGGIAGGAWDVDGQNISIRNCYNTGLIKCTNNNNWNGGILGGTYNFANSNNTSMSYNTITSCYNIGTIEAASPNQISPRYTRVTYSYYVSKRTNTSGYGTGKVEDKFKTTDMSSVWFGIRLQSTDVWVVNEKNNGYLSLCWQNE